MAGILQAAEYAVIVKADSPVNKISQNELRNLYLRRQNFIENQKVIPINTLANNEGRLEFEQRVLIMQRNKLNKYWIKQHFKGITPPSTVASYKAALLFVSNVEGAIAYIPLSMVNQTVKVIYEY
ncbi:hypothetical protein [Sulfurimonas sp. C5]|uniref:hypothetical protein n=1 Tax=Sulfurimonas sp. C5 TaxID=3036947 RepID=UPI002454FBDC|nr:hypothetical protein [Sulfurimonas sp. C5]MDH4943772.1 hypothetical protein [Sulfurimonas sp. C5]